jgi:hypothetical protein
MKKNYLSLALSMSVLAMPAFGQQTRPCATDEMHQHYKSMNPAVAEYEKMLNDGIEAYLAAKAHSGHIAGKTTADGAHNDTDYYDIPVVVHIIHNFGGEYVKDSAIYVMMANLNKFYNKQNDLSGIIATFKPYIGNAKIRFHLATRDPLGRPTTGITRRFSYLTNGGDDQAKFDQWSPVNYFNIWIENKIGSSPTSGTTLAYSTFPASAEAFPYSDGVITAYPYIMDKKTMEHEVGHFFNLLHVWSLNGLGPGEGCGDDAVDDTPPTKGHFSTCPLYDSACATNYFKIYTRASGVADSLVNYPDTANVQNVMDYSSCPHVMLTGGQVWRMRAALNSNIGGRNNLWDSTNLRITGALDPVPDLPPVTEFTSKASPSAVPITLFTFPEVPLYFTNKSWRDTITKVKWNFSNNALNATPEFNTYTGINNAFANSFKEVGWVNITLDATGNNSGTTSTNYEKAVFVADYNGIDPLGYVEDFNEGGKREKWPFFNYYKNEFKWQQANVGTYDNACMMYKGYDNRTDINLYTGTPYGDYDDLYSIPFDLSKFTSGPCYLYFSYSGASRSSLVGNINDTLLIEYSVDKQHTWNKLDVMGKNTLCNMGTVPTEYVPASAADWDTHGINLPAAARKSYVVFRFRYKPGVNMTTKLSTGNNFYLDRVQIAPWAVDVNDPTMGNVDVKIMPYPTSGDAYVVVKDAYAAQADIVITDITGKAVYKTTEAIKGNVARVIIPQQVIATPGIYLVQTITGSQVNTQKLVVQ